MHLCVALLCLDLLRWHKSSVCQSLVAALLSWMIYRTRFLEAGFWKLDSPRLDLWRLEFWGLNIWKLCSSGLDFSGLDFWRFDFQGLGFSGLDLWRLDLWRLNSWGLDLWRLDFWPPIPLLIRRYQHINFEVRQSSCALTTWVSFTKETYVENMGLFYKRDLCLRRSGVTCLIP